MNHSPSSLRGEVRDVERGAAENSLVSVHQLNNADDSLCSKRKSAICFVNRCYWPDSEATGQLLTELAESLTEQFDVHVICGQPNSPVTDDYVRHGIQTKNLVTIHRLQHSQFPKRIPAGRIFNLISFSRSTDRYLRQCKTIFEVLVSETDPFLLPPVVAKHATRHGIKFVAYLQDIYPDVAIAIGKAKPGLISSSIRRRLRDAYRSADHIIVLGDCMRQRLIQPPWSLDADRIQIIPNWADTESIVPVASHLNKFRKQQNWQDRFVVMHSGNMGLTQRLDRIIDSLATSLNNDHARDSSSRQWPKNSLLALVGDGANQKSLRKLADQRLGKQFGQHLTFLPYQPRKILSESLSAADVHIVSMAPTITGCLCPSKLYGILAAGRPLIAIASPETELSKIVRDHNIGICVDPHDEVGIAAAVAQMAGDKEQRFQMGKRARELAIEKFDRKVIQKKFRLLLGQLLGTVESCSSQHAAENSYEAR